MQKYFLKNSIKQTLKTKGRKTMKVSKKCELQADIYKIQELEKIQPQVPNYEKYRRISPAVITDKSLMPKWCH